MPVEDLDAIAPEPFVVKKDGKEYELRPTVAAMVEIDKLKLDSPDMPTELMVKILARFGLPEEVCQELTLTELSHLIDRVMSHFFPEGVAEEEGKQSTGRTPSPPSTVTSEEIPQT